MRPRRSVNLDPDAMADGGRYVVIEAPTGVFYQQQYGGHACRQGEVEGYLVPVGSPEALAALRDLFENELGGAGTWNLPWPDALRERLRGIIESVPYWTSAGAGVLGLDDSRPRDIDEAWVPVTTPDGPAVLLWFNSD